MTAKAPKEEILKALLEIGFKQPYEHSPNQLEFEGYPLKIYDGETLETIFKKLIKAGRVIKAWEIARALESN